MKKILITLLLIAVFALASCQGGTKTSNDPSKTNGNNNNTNADLKITFFNGGYGEEWINNLAKRFEEAKGVKVEVVSSNEGNCGAENYIKAGYNLSDIYFGENIPWKSLVQGGYLADLTDVYEAEVETKGGNVKIKDFLTDTASAYFYSQRQLKTPEYNPWAMAWTIQPNAMAYNEDILKAMKHVSTIEVTDGVVNENGFWVAPPKTIQDMYAFAEDVTNFNTSEEKKALGDEHQYAAYGFAGQNNIDSIGFMIISWWAEAQGLKTSNYAGEGSFYDFYNFGNTVDSNAGQTVSLKGYEQTGLKNAFNTLADFLFDENGNYQNTLNNPYNNNSQQLQQLFVANKVGEKPVLSIASSYLENEVIKNRYIDSDQDGKQDVNFKFMNVPKLSADSEDILYGRLSDCAVIPAKAAHLELAKEFLVFMNSEQEIINFSKETNGGIRPFKCDVRTEATGNEYSAFVNSLFDVYYGSKIFTEYPSNVTSIKQVSHVYRYESPLYMGNISWTEIINVMRAPGEGKLAGDVIVEAVISRMRQTELNGWLTKYRLTEIN